MPTFNEIEKIVEDYERKIEKLKNLEEQLEKLDTKGFEKETSEIKKRLKDPKSIEKVEGDIRKLKNKIEESKKKVEEPEEPVKEPQRPDTPRHFPYELTPDYKNIGLIGTGGFARVFRANRRSDGKEVAVKIPISLDRSIGKSFMREMNTWTKLKHQNIVELYDHNILPVPYFEMEKCDSSLDIISKPIDLEKALWIIFNVAEGLKYAHNEKIAHRDMKPQNILLREGIPKISDWGLSKLTAESKTSTMAAFSPVYAAPEHISPEKFGAKDEQTDIWQLGVIFYELVTGKLPFQGDDFINISLGIVNKDFIPASELNINAEKVDNIIKKCLQKEKANRYKNMEELQRDIAKVLNIEYKSSLKESNDVKDLSKSAYYCAELLVVNMKIGEKKDVYKYATDMLKYAKDSIKNELSGLVKELEEIIENNLDINEQLIEKADIIVHKIRMGE
jgi:serine/threonine protein kinase